MTKRNSIILLLIIILTGTVRLFAQDQSTRKVARENPKNIILLIGDGMGLPQIYATVAATKDNLNILRCTNMAFVKTSSADDEVTDSAAGGTAIATGTKTNNGNIGVSADFKPLVSILKIAEKNNVATGLVATSDITHATPASFIACVANRSQMADIALDFLRTDVDVFIGGGLNQFAKRADSLNLIDSLKSRGYQIAYNIDEVSKVTGGKLAGLLYPEHPVKISEGRGDMLSIATAKAIEILSQDNDGFFLMVEGSQIDWGGHDNNIDYVVSELKDFDKAVGIALDFADKNPETLVIITADHETGGLTFVESKTQSDKMEASFSTTHHTALPVVLFSYGKMAHEFHGMIENTDIFVIMNKLFGFNKVQAQVN